MFVSFAASQTVVPRLGIVANISQDSLVRASGFTMIGASVTGLLSPKITDEAFEEKLLEVKSARCKVITANLFFPAELKVAGGEVDEENVLSYARVVLSRARKVGIKFIVFGSGSARNIPEGYDREKAKADFIKRCYKIAKIASKYQVTIVLENLEKTETNFITSLKEAAVIVRAINHRNFRLNADIFHMMRQSEPPADLLMNGDIIALCELAEKEKRTLPGVMKDNFKPYFSALKTIGYQGYIFIEGSTKEPVVEYPQAYLYLTAQLNEVYLNK
ncbi:hypothetical protein AB669_05085 [Pedobacter sp. BMA]|nr:hypothetical protein AB669_05085 [Pedobacter sp. BMA]